MIHTLTLEEKDLRIILADHFDVPLEAVTVYAKEEHLGYGIGEHSEWVAEARIST